MFSQRFSSRCSCGCVFRQFEAVGFTLLTKHPSCHDKLAPMLRPHKPRLPWSRLASEASHTYLALITIFMKKYFSSIGIKSTGWHPLTVSNVRWHMKYIGPCYSWNCFLNDFFIVFIILYPLFFIYILFCVNVYKMIPSRIIWFLFYLI